MRNLTFRTMGCFLAGVVFSAPAWGADAKGPGTAYPGTLNYVEGQASIGSEALNSKSIGAAQLEAGQTLATGQGKAELLLTPGVFLRVGDNSTVKLVSPSITDTDVELQKGEATVEVTEIHPENRLVIDERGGAARLVKTGFYDFDANQEEVRVFEGEALVEASNSDKQIRVKGGHEVDLNATNIKSHGFDKKTYESSDLYNWSSLRSAYVAEANADVAPTYVPNGWYGPGWIGAGWYWDPWFSCYTFLPGDGIFYSPFGWGFYSPFWAYSYFGGFYGPHYFHRFGVDPHTWGPGPRNAPTLRGGNFRDLHPSSPLMSNPRGFGGFRGAPAYRGGLNGGFRGTESGGFHSGGFGGFHEGGFGGGFHGGTGGAHGPGR
jgi:FecR protein